MPVEIITREDLANFKKELLQDLKTIISESKPQEKKWIKGADVRKIMSISYGTLQTLRINGTLPFTKVGGIIYYKLTDIEKLLDKNSIK